MIARFVQQRPGALVVLAGAAMMMLWGGALFIEPTMRPTPLAMLVELAHDVRVSPQLLAVLFGVVAWHAGYALWLNERRRLTYALIPQQVLLVAATWGPLRAVWLGVYADGVRCCSSTHIFVDQLPMIMFTWVHTVATVVCLRNAK